jgi:hypothetical protein
MLIKLPNGLLDGVDLFNYCNIDELRGKQQNYLANSKLVVNNIGHVPKILGDMVLSFQTEQGLTWKGKIEDAIYKIPSGDIETILIKLRENTYGPRFYYEAICTHCEFHHKDKNQLRLDLDTLELDPLPITEMMTPKKVVLPKSGLEVEFKPIYLKDIFSAIKIGTGSQEKLISESLALSIKTINGQPATSESIENIPISDIYFLSDENEKLKMEGTLDTKVETTCVECGKDFSTKLNPLKADFFSRTGGYLSMSI